MNPSTSIALAITALLALIVTAFSFLIHFVVTGWILSPATLVLIFSLVMIWLLIGHYMICLGLCITREK